MQGTQSQTYATDFIQFGPKVLDFLRVIRIKPMLQILNRLPLKLSLVLVYSMIHENVRCLHIL